MPANVFEWDGWEGQYRRARRWYRRLVEVANDWDSYGLDEQLDYAIVFFQTAYHLRDFLLLERVVPQAALDDLMAQSRPLRISRDIANGSKHRVISSASVDRSPWITRSLNFGPTPRLTLKVDPDLLDLVGVATDCLSAWDGFLRGCGLDPESLSAPAQALDDALRAQASAHQS